MSSHVIFGLVRKLIKPFENTNRLSPTKKAFCSRAISTPFIVFFLVGKCLSFNCICGLDGHLLNEEHWLCLYQL